jgi:3'-phosphoadenosine 5'-phosphosulfate (PAPS) 3'-phosphatase
MERQYILDAIDAALCAGKDILSIYNDPASDFQIEKKADNSPLTIADKKAHATIAGYLQNTPYPLLSEEGGCGGDESGKGGNKGQFFDKSHNYTSFLKGLYHAARKRTSR